MFGFLMGTLQKFKEKEESVKVSDKVGQILCTESSMIAFAGVSNIIAHDLYLILMQCSLPFLSLILPLYPLPSHSR